MLRHFALKWRNPDKVRYTTCVGVGRRRARVFEVLIDVFAVSRGALKLATASTYSVRHATVSKCVAVLNTMQRSTRLLVHVIRIAAYAMRRATFDRHCSSDDGVRPLELESA